MTTPEQAAAEAYADKTCGVLPFGGNEEMLYHFEWCGIVAGFLEACRQVNERANIDRVRTQTYVDALEIARKRIAELEAELARLQVYIRDNHASKAMADDNRRLRDQLADLTGGLSVEEFKRLFLEMQKNIAETIAALSDE
jgi:hypothetical protein